MSIRPDTETGREAVRLRGLFGGETEERASLWVRRIEAEAREHSAGVAPPKPITDISVLSIPDLTAEEIEAFDAAMGQAERSAGVAPLDVEDLGWVLYEMGVDDLDLEDARKLAAHIIVRLAARLSEGTDR